MIEQLQELNGKVKTIEAILMAYINTKLSAEEKARFLDTFNKQLKELEKYEDATEDD